MCYITTNQKCYRGEFMYIRKQMQKLFSLQKNKSIVFCLLFYGMNLLLLQGSEPDLAAGDNAFTAKDYAVAASFYTSCLNKLKKLSAPPEKLREVYERLMDSLLFGGLSIDAEKYLKEYKKSFPNANTISVDMWQGEIFVQKGLFVNALPLYEKLISALHNRDPRKLRALSAYARTLEHLKRYPDAAKVYAMLREQAGDSFMGRKALLYQTLAAIHAKDHLQAEKLIAQIKPLPEHDDVYGLLILYHSFWKNGLAESKNAFLKFLAQKNKIPSARKGTLPATESDPLLYLVASTYGDAFAKEKASVEAAASYRLAYQAASNNKELFQTLSRLIKTVETAGDYRKAASLARKQVEFFRHPLVNAQARLRIAHILEKDKQDTEAEKLYESIFHDLNATKEQKKESCKKYLFLKIRNKKSAEGIAFLRKTFQNKNVEINREMLIADTLAEAGLYQESIAVYDSLGTSAATSTTAAEAFYKALLLALETKQKDSVESLYKKFLAHSPSAPQLKQELPFLSGIKKRMEGKKKQAGKFFAEYIALRPAPLLKNLPEALREYAMLSLEEKEYKTAAYCLKRLQKEFPGDPASPLAIYWLVHLYFLQNDELAAEQSAWQLAEKYPDSPLVPEALLRLCRHYTENGEINKSASALKRLTRLPSAAKAGDLLKGKILLEQSRIAIRQGEKTTALEYLQQVVKKIFSGPVYQKAGCRMGELLYEMGMIEEAVEAYSKASVATGSDPLLTFAAQGALGNILLSARSQDQDCLKQALACFQAIAGESSAPDEFKAEAIYKAGRCHELLGEKAEAENLYKQLLYSYPAGSILKNPAISLWCVKAAEYLIDSAAKTPVLSAFENARNALHYLHNAGLISQQDARNRFNALKQMKFNP